MSELHPRHAELFNLRRPALIAGAAGLALCAIELIFDREQFFRSYLVGYLFWFNIAMGSMGIVMMHHLVGGAWGLLIRRIGEAAAMTLPLMVVLFIPIVLGVRYLYPWADPDEVAREVVVRHRHLLFTPGWFVLRAAVYFAVWLFLAWRLRSLSLRRDSVGNHVTDRKLLRLSALGLVAYFLTMSLAAIDWIMSREVHWYSSIFGFIVIVGQGLAGLVFMLVALARLAEAPPLANAVRPNYLNDLGNLLLTLVILFAYVSFAQFLVTWMGNTQEDVTWYVHRSHGGWRVLAAFLIVLHFFVPFFMLLFRSVKRRLPRLAMLAGALLFLHLLYVVWLVEPSSRGPEPHGVSWTDLVAPVGVGGIWLAAFLWLLARRPLLPLGEEFPAEVDHHEGTSPSPAL